MGGDVKIMENNKLSILVRPELHPFPKEVLLQMRLAAGHCFGANNKEMQMICTCFGVVLFLAEDVERAVH